LIVLFLIPLMDRLYAGIAGFGLNGVFSRAVISAVCLLPPTLLMGASLPAIARWMESTPHGISWLGFFYGGNIAGAVCGSLLAGFYLLREYDMAIATYVAVAINVAVGALGLVLAKQAPYTPAESVTGNAAPPRGEGARTVFVLHEMETPQGGEETTYDSHR